MSSTHEKSIADSTSRLSLEDFTYELPPELIAREPAIERSSSRLMVLHRSSGTLEHKIFADLPQYLNKNDVVVINDTKVIPARIIAHRKTGGLVEILLLKPVSTSPGIWEAMANPLRKLKQGDQLHVDANGGDDIKISIAGFIETTELQRRVLIDFGGNKEVFTLLNKIGQAPLPPYILKQRSSNHEQTGAVSEKHQLQEAAGYLAGSTTISAALADPSLLEAAKMAALPEGSPKAPRVDDLERYQTVYARAPGAVAAPTAGLHFTKQLFEQLERKGVRICRVTLHVGPGTFKPITSSIEEHSVEAEEFQVSPEAAQIINECRRLGGRIIAVGTTSCRTLETAGATGVLQASENASSSLYIRPGHKFAVIDALVTNFHLSRSSLLVLVSAFAGHKQIMAAYREAINQRYRFYSYGDAMLII